MLSEQSSLAWASNFVASSGKREGWTLVFSAIGTDLWVAMHYGLNFPAQESFILPDVLAVVFNSPHFLEPSIAPKGGAVLLPRPDGSLSRLPKAAQIRRPQVVGILLLNE